MEEKIVTVELPQVVGVFKTPQGSTRLFWTPHRRNEWMKLTIDINKFQAIEKKPGAERTDEEMAGLEEFNKFKLQLPFDKLQKAEGDIWDMGEKIDFETLKSGDITNPTASAIATIYWSVLIRSNLPTEAAEKNDQPSSSQPA